MKVLFSHLRREHLSQSSVKPLISSFTDNAHAVGAFSRAQCGGAPADLLTAFMLVDVPETEAILYEPGFSRIPASAAALAGKDVVTSESFTKQFPFLCRNVTPLLRGVAFVNFKSGFYTLFNCKTPIH